MKFDKLYSGYYNDDASPFDELAKKNDQHDHGELPMGYPIVEHAREPHELEAGNNALILWGGSDINPKFYGHPKGRRTGDAGLRDEMEWALLQRAVTLGLTIIGVCRGAQMLCAAAGGYLLQHVGNHMGYHDVVTQDGTVLGVNSIHHQMMNPFGVEHELLAWTPKPRSMVDDKPTYLYQDDKLFPIPENWVEPEYVYFPKIKGHAIQWHPEAMVTSSPATRFIMKSINER